jgi:hypothetical protein
MRRLVLRLLVVAFIALQFEAFLGLLLSPKVSAAALAVASAASETPQTTTSVSYVASDTTIASGSLPAGTYFVTWGAAVANSANTNVSNARLVRGTTEIAAQSYESMAATAANMGIARSGYWLGTLSGSEALTIEFSGSAGTTYIDSKFIKAIRLDTNLAADTDYFTSGSQESATDEVTNAALTSWTDIKTLTKTFSSSDTEDYLVFASMEASPDTVPNDCSSRIEVDGTAMMTSTVEGQDITDQQGYAVAKLSSIGAGSKSIKLQGQSVGTATCDYRRSRIYVFRASVFDQAVESYVPAESTLASATWTDKNSRSYTPNQSETVMVMGSRIQGTGGAACPIATRLDDGTAQYADTHAFTPSNVTTDYAIGMSATSLSVSSAKTFKAQFQRVTSTCTVKIKESTLIIWSMTLRDAAVYDQSAYRWFSNTVGTGASGTWWDVAWKNRRKITFSNSQSSENLTNFTVRVSLVGSGASKNIDYNRTQNAGQDIRFIDANGTTVLKHEIEKWSETGTSEVWVNVPQIDTASNTDFIWMYYNNTAASDGQDAANTWNTGHKGIWHMKEDPSTVHCTVNKEVCDSTSNANNADSSGTMTSTDQVPAVINGGLDLDGVNDSLVAPDSTSLDMSTELTISAWVRRSADPSGYETIVMKEAGGVDANYALQLNSSNLLDFNFVISGSVYVEDVGTTALATNTWYRVSATYNNAANQVKIYINGVLDATVTDNNNITPNAAALSIGINNGNEPFPGLVDEVQISNVARSGEWIEAEYKTQNNQMNTFAAEETDPNYTPLAAADTAYTLTATGQAFRLRMLLHVANNDLPTGAASFKLQYAQKSGTCDTGFSGETYGDVGTASGVIRYKDNTGETDGAPLLNDTDDPTHSGHTVSGQTYEESNNFTSTSRINRGEDGKWEFALVDNSAPGATSYCFRVVTSAGSAIGTPEVVPEIITANTPPTVPASLAQKKTDDTVIATGDWVNQNSIKFTATISDPDASDTLQLCVEKDVLLTSFSTTEDLCGTGVAYSGTPVAASVTITGITDANEYHWQARVKDAGGLYSTWSSYGANLETVRDFGIDTTAPTGGTVFDGTSAGVDASFNDNSLSSLSANWSGFNAGVSGLLRYEYSIGTTAGATDIRGWTNNTTATSVTATGLTLQTSQMYFFNVRAVDNAGNAQTAVSSNGQLVAPSLSFSVSPAALTFANLNGTNAYTDTEPTTLTTSTNAYGGYAVRLAATDYLRSGSSTIPDFTGGSYASPDSWQSGDTGFGYTSNDTNVQGVDKFQAATCPGGTAVTAPGCYAPYSQIKPGDIVADHTALTTGSPITSEQFTITHRVTAPPNQAAKTYTVILIYGIVALY